MVVIFEGIEEQLRRSAEDRRQLEDRVSAWCDELSKKRKFTVRQLSPAEVEAGFCKKDQHVADEQYTESNETIIGYFIVEVDSAGEAVAFARNFPLLSDHGSVEVWPIADSTN